MPAKSSNGATGQPKRKRGRPKKSDQSTLDKEPTTPTKPLNSHEKQGLKLLTEQTRQSQIMRYIIAGYSKEEISDELEISVATVTNVVGRMYDRIDHEVAELRQNWVSVSLLRTEVMLKKLMISVTDKEHDLEKSDVDMLSKLVTLQQKIMGSAGGPNVAIQNNYYSPQLDGQSAAYRYSLANEQNRITGKTMDGLEDYVMHEDDEANKLDGLLDDADSTED